MTTKILIICMNLFALLCLPLGIWSILNVLAIVVAVAAIYYHDEMTGG